MIDEALLRPLLTRLSRQAFERLIVRLFSKDASEPFTPLPQAGANVFFQPILDSYGGSLHRVFVTHYSPLHLFTKFSPRLIADPDLQDRIARVWQLYKGQRGSWGMASPFLKEDRKLQSFAILTNLNGFTRSYYEGNIIPAYQETAKRLRLRAGTMHVGSYDSFVDLDLDGIRQTFAEFIAHDAGELSIGVSDEGPLVQRVAVERPFSAGVLSASVGPLEPLYATLPDDAVLEEFSELLERQVSENRLEQFLSANFRLIFGPQYDRLEAQVWLRCPELDIGKRRRRLDMFMRNSVTQDWELHELKLPNVRLTGTVRDVPMFASAVISALQQVRNYGRLLTQDRVKRHLEKQGIHYCEPVLRLVVGRSPEVSHDRWRWLVDGCRDVKITTYDELLKEAQVRATHRADLLDLLSP